MPEFREFVKKEGCMLYHMEQPFRYSGANVPYCSKQYINNKNRNRIHCIVKTAKEMGLRVLRPWCLMFQGYGPAWQDEPCWAPGVSIMPELDKFRDSAFDNIDYFIKVCSDEGIFLDFMLTGEDVHYGAQAFIEWRGSNDIMDFYSDSVIISDYKRYITTLLNHTNQYSGIKYKDDPTIMIWEIGEETWKETEEWAENIASHIKEIAPNQLVMDGDSKIMMKGKKAPSIDIISRHYYPCFGSEHEWNLDLDARTAREYNKVFVLNEWDWIGWNTGNLNTREMADTIFNNHDVSGDLWFQFLGPYKEMKKKYLSEQNWFAGYPDPEASRQERLNILKEHAFLMSGNLIPSGK